VTPDELREWVAETLANFKVPAYVEITDQLLPRNAAGKVIKDVLRGEGELRLTETL
jgi:long-chain acyl-CoA synthetase